MNWQAKYFLFLVLSSLGFAACNDDGKIGPELEPQNQNFGVSFTQVSPISLSTVLVDSFRSTSTDRLLAGTYSDPSSVGEVSVTAFTELNLRNDNLTFANASTVFDSMVLHLEVDYVYGDTTQDFTLSVHRITEPLLEDEDYYQADNFTYEPTALGSTLIRPTGLLGTVVSIPFDTAMARALFYEKSNSPEYANQASFEAYFNGLALVATGSPKAVVGFKLNINGFSSTNLRLYYHNANEQLSVDFLLNNNVTRVNSFNVDRTGTPVAALSTSYNELPAPANGGISYVQSGTGLRTGFDLPDFSTLVAGDNKVIVNRALLKITPDPSQVLLPPSSLLIYLRDANSGRIAIRNGFSLTVQNNGRNVNDVLNPLSVFYDKDKGEYSADITDYVQARILGAVPSSGLILSPALNAQAVNSLILNSSTGIRLELYYTDGN